MYIQTMEALRNSISQKNMFLPFEVRYPLVPIVLVDIRNRKGKITITLHFFVNKSSVLRVQGGQYFNNGERQVPLPLSMKH